MTSVKLADVFSSIANDINKRFKLEVAVPGTGVALSEVAGWVPTVSHLLNLIFGRVEEDESISLGVPRGRIMEIFGNFSEGKSTVCQHIMNGFQAAGGISTQIDSESGWDKVRAARMGHLAERHMHVDVLTCEEGFEVLYEMNEKYYKAFGGEVPIVYVWDTIAASPTKGEKDGDQYAEGMGWKARLIRQELRRFTHELSKNNATLVFANQTIESFGNKSPIPTTSGGGGVKFWSSQRLYVRRVATFKEYGKPEPAGIITAGKMVKNKLGPPMKVVDLPITYSTGIDPRRELLNFHLDHSSYVNIAGAYKKIVGFQEKDISFYDKDTPRIFEENPTLLDWLKEKATEVWFSEE